MSLYAKPTSYEGKFQGQGMVSITFDDARANFARNAVPILQRYGLLATTFAVTGWSDGTWTPPEGYMIVPDGPCKVDELKHCHSQGFEIAAHGDTHANTEADLVACVNKLKMWGLTRNAQVETFASPENVLTLSNLPTNQQWYKRSGLNTARTGFQSISTAKNALNNIPYPPVHQYFLTSNIVYASDTLATLQPVIMDAIMNKRWCILQFHSILFSNEDGYGDDIWYWDAENFRKLCEWLGHIPSQQCLVVTMRDGWRYASGAK